MQTSTVSKKPLGPFKSHPNGSRLVLGALLMLAALLVSSLIRLPGILNYIIPVGLILFIMVNWLMYRSENKDLGALGFDLKGRNLWFLPLGLLLGLIAESFNFLARSILKGDMLHLNASIDILALAEPILILLPMAAAQQFLIRSYCFKKTIEISSVTVANIIFGLIFIAMHNVFNMGLFEALFYSIALFISHLLFSTALLSSGTIYFAIGIHWGCNVGNDHLLVSGPSDTALVYATEQLVQNGQDPGPGLPVLLLFLIASNIGYVLFGVLIWKWKRIRSWNTDKTGQTD
ncbi:type II CAAX prenyl endopeptidase Rce1 family protein [Flagellimonas sp.]|uniref:CPBP family glutamic-type intramembrane protease n=1 Tax=Flagellimonas sp. TaxID=2058762 RepID=UPI003B527790